jgi:hypothetical protein
MLSRHSMVHPLRGARRSGPCIMGGVSPSLHHARQSVTGPIFTGPAQTTCTILQFGFREPKFAQVVGPASSGSSQSQDLTKASRRAPLTFPSLQLSALADRPRARHRRLLHRHPREGGDPANADAAALDAAAAPAHSLPNLDVAAYWVPAFAGMTGVRGAGARAFQEARR